MSTKATPALAVLVGLLFLSSAAVASQANTGFAAYKITATTPLGVHSVVVNETVRSTDKAGFNDLILQLTGGSQNLTYSRLVNSSTDYLPYLSSLTSQALSYSNGTTSSVHANFTSAGTKEVRFQGSNYTLSVYTLSVSGVYQNNTVSATGTIEAFPSSLVYSVSVSSGMLFEVDAVLQGTNLPLTSGPSQMATVAVVGAGLGVGGIALAAALLVRRRDRQAAKVPEQKPEHWVD